MLHFSFLRLGARCSYAFQLSRAEAAIDWVLADGRYVIIGAGQQELGNGFLLQGRRRFLVGVFGLKSDNLVRFDAALQYGVVQFWVARLLVGFLRARLSIFRLRHGPRRIGRRSLELMRSLGGKLLLFQIRQVELLNRVDQELVLKLRLARARGNHSR